MLYTDFNLEDIVAYELSWWGKPRWINNVDRGGSGIWEDGEVVGIRKTHFIVKGRTGESLWPIKGHYRFQESQWQWAGYIKLVKKSNIIKNCECGADKCGTTHSIWCPKY